MTDLASIPLTALDGSALSLADFG
ncbi:glutathione peroxidase, partial [Mycobacteroides abscessus subsp. abscessus]|nr:glutathione peroxidase [Mycobacteroides abscessus subsp. abscessus]